MHRTQILLEPAQYRKLKERASAENASLGEFLRRLIDHFLGASDQVGRLESFAGVLRDKECQSTHFKKFIYSNARKNLR